MDISHSTANHLKGCSLQVVAIATLLGNWDEGTVFYVCNVTPS